MFESILDCYAEEKWRRLLKTKTLECTSSSVFFSPTREALKKNVDLCVESGFKEMANNTKRRKQKSRLVRSH